VSVFEGFRADTTIEFFDAHTIAAKISKAGEAKVLFFPGYAGPEISPAEGKRLKT